MTKTGKKFFPVLLFGFKVQFFLKAAPFSLFPRFDGFDLFLRIALCRADGFDNLENVCNLLRIIIGEIFFGLFQKLSVQFRNIFDLSRMRTRGV